LKKKETPNSENGAGPWKPKDNLSDKTEGTEESEEVFAPPRQHRNFVDAGVVSQSQSEESNIADESSAAHGLPLPLGADGEALLAAQDFQLPYDLVYMQQKDNNITDKRQTGKRQNKIEAMQEFQLVKKNIYVHRKEYRLETDEVSTCSCDWGSKLKEGEVPCCVDDCQNAAVFTECDPRCCPNGAKCTNQRLQRRQYAKTHVRNCGAKGWGLYSAEQVKKGDLILEYVGEVIDEQTCAQRQMEYKNEKHKYFMTLRAGEMIDASRKAGRGRFCNHSCDPNCETEKWSTNGELRVGIFALRDVPPAQELTFDYKFERYGSERQRCFCGAAICRGFLGSSPEDRANAALDNKKNKQQQQQQKVSPRGKADKGKGKGKGKATAKEAVEGEGDEGSGDAEGSGQKRKLEKGVDPADGVSTKVNWEKMAHQWMQMYVREGALDKKIQEKAREKCIFLCRNVAQTVSSHSSYHRDTTADLEDEEEAHINGFSFRPRSS
jgi:histone-lysine N-methyltransferase SETD2